MNLPNDSQKTKIILIKLLITSNSGFDNRNKKHI